jgi:hypothetical protein
LKKVLFTLLILSYPIFSQTFEEREGSVSFLSSQNVYVRFNNTEGIKEGDTLYSKEEGILIPAVKAKYISTSSVAGEFINGKQLKVNDILITKAAIANEEKEDIQVKDDFMLPTTPVVFRKPPESKSVSLEKINGRLSVNSYSSYSNNLQGDFQRWRYTLSFDGRNIGETPVSVKSHLNFNYRTDEWSEISNNPVRNLRVYDLSVLYRLSERSDIILGRHLNHKISNVGPVDGIQFNHSIGGFNAGLFTGSRPDFSNLGFNLKLFQYGVYVNRTDTVSNKIIDNTVAFVNQTNNMNTDRRILYFQHTNNYFSELSFFMSAEADLFKIINNESRNELSLTGLFLSLRYSPLTFASFNISYDARRNIIYYETYKNFLETLIDNEMRQGFRGSINLRPMSDVYAGFNIGYRFRKGDLRPSNDLGAYISYSVLPYVNVSPSLSYTRIKSSFITGNIYGAIVTRHFDFLSSSFSLVYRNSRYSLISDITSVQNSIT